MVKIYIGTIIVLSVTTNILFSKLFNKNIKTNYYGSKNKKRIIKRFTKKIKIEEKREAKIEKARLEIRNKKLVKKHLKELKMEKLSEKKVKKINLMTIEKAKSKNKQLTLEIDKYLKPKDVEYKKKKSYILK